MIIDQLTQHCAVPETKNTMAPRPSVFPPNPRQRKPTVDRHSIWNQHYHCSIYHFLPQKRNTPVILASENPCSSPWLWHKMLSNSEITWPCLHSSRLLSFKATVKNQPCPWLKLLFLNTFSNLNLNRKHSFLCTGRNSAQIKELKTKRIIQN